MMYEVQPRLKVPSRKKVAEGVWELFMVEKAKIISVIGKTLNACLMDWAIYKVFTIAVDNASVNDWSVEYIAQSLKAMNTLMLDGKYLHLRMDRMANVLMDVPTRWNATYKMLEGAFKYRQVIDKMTYSCEVFQAYFLKEEKVKKVMVKRQDEIVKKVVKYLNELYNEYKGVGGVVSQIDEDNVDDEVAQIGDDVDVTFQLMQQFVQKRKDEQYVELSNEVDKYLTDPFESPLSKQFNLLNLWKGNQTRYPILSQVAKDIFAIPSSTVASENAFSLGKRIVDPFRTSLHPKIVKALVCTCDWLRADEFSFYKEPTDGEVEFYKEMEHITTYRIGAHTSQSGPSNPLTTTNT
ncbi:hypothetical protein L3X38_033475 [Prunus dulcis]|uniref:HAT C-terminal dimerisation domain-containing protein n=1 Tax=Prunus dulcis TaxID=3755 RepID=A0AAD4VHN3_PRUDU|nr:hypothetical protein L3X38_033475 [Prunus dulcis]